MIPNANQTRELPPLPRTTPAKRLMMRVHELSLSMSEQMLSLSMLIVATHLDAALILGVQTANQINILNEISASFVFSKVLNIFLRPHVG